MSSNNAGRRSDQCAKLIVNSAVVVFCLIIAVVPVGAQTPDTAGARTKFKSNCVSCHGQDGAGTDLGKSMQTPDLRSPEVQKHSDGELARFITEGKGNMPSFRKSLNEDQIRSLVQYIRELASKKNPSQN